MIEKKKKQYEIIGKGNDRWKKRNFSRTTAVLVGVFALVKIVFG